MNKPDAHDASKYEVQTGEEVTIRIESYGVAPPAVAAVDGQPLTQGPPFKFEVKKATGGVHVAAVQCDFPPENTDQVKHVLYVRGSRGGEEYLVTTIYPETPIKRVVLTFDVK